MTRIIKGQVIALAALMAAMVVTLAACGGGSSSSGGSSSGSSITGTVDDGLAAVDPTGRDADEPAWLAAVDLFIRHARAAGVPGVTVQLTNAGGSVVGTQTTNANGRFAFNGLAPGNYSLRLSQDGSELGQTPLVEVDSSTRTEVQLSLQGTITSTQVASTGGSDDDSLDDDSSDDDSLDDDSSDDDSLDDDSADDDSDDDSSDD